MVHNLKRRNSITAYSACTVAYCMSSVQSHDTNDVVFITGACWWERWTRSSWSIWLPGMAVHTLWHSLCCDINIYPPVDSYLCTVMLNYYCFLFQFTRVFQVPQVLPVRVANQVIRWAKCVFLKSNFYHNFLRKPIIVPNC